MSIAQKWCEKHNCTLTEQYKNEFTYMTSNGMEFYIPYEELESLWKGETI